MKKNILLITFLGTLLLFAYWWEERGLKSSFNDQNFLEISLLSEIHEIEFDQLTLKHTQNWFSDSGYPLTSLKIENFFKKFKEVKLIREVDKYNYVHDHKWLSLKRINKNCSFYFSPLNEATGNFFITRQCDDLVHHWLAESAVTFDGLYQNELDRKLKSYHALISQLLHPDLEEFTDVAIFEFWQVKKLVLSNEKKTESVDFALKLTSPQVIDGLSYDEFSFINNEKKLRSQIPKILIKTTQLGPQIRFVSQIGIGDQFLKVFEKEGKCFVVKSQWAAQVESCSIFEPEIYLYWQTAAIDFTKALKTDQFRAKVGEKIFQLPLDDKILSQPWKVMLCYLSKCNENFTPYFVGKNSLKDKDLELTYNGEGAEIKINPNTIEVYSLKEKVLFKFPNTYKLKLEDLHD